MQQSKHTNTSYIPASGDNQPLAATNKRKLFGLVEDGLLPAQGAMREVTKKPRQLKIADQVQLLCLVATYRNLSPFQM